MLTVLSSVGQNNQSTEKILQRLNTYIDFNGSLKNLIVVDATGIKLYSDLTKKKANKPNLTLLTKEYSVFLNLFSELSTDSISSLLEKKGNSGFSKEIVSHFSNTPAYLPLKKDVKPLLGLKIAIDAGHFAGDFETSKIEQKYLEFIPAPYSTVKDTIRISEGVITWQTAFILKNKLEEQGALVFLTRTVVQNTSFGISYQEWISKRKQKTLDSLFTCKILDEKEYSKLLKADAKKLFWDFFRDYELANRAKIINQWKPDLTVVIHYNVDEKNTDWLKPTAKNYSMCFIGGAMNTEAITKPKNRVHLLRLLLKDDLNQSEELSKQVVNQFSTSLSIPIAKAEHADYLAKNCLSTNSQGVFCRNLLLCRLIASPLVYGECLYQDNEKECRILCNNNVDLYGIKTNSRTVLVADSYLNGILSFVEKRK